MTSRQSPIRTDIELWYVPDLMAVSPDMENGAWLLRPLSIHYEDCDQGTSSVEDAEVRCLKLTHKRRCIPVRGTTSVRVEYGPHKKTLPITIVEGTLPSLLGLDWFRALGMGVTGIYRSDVNLKDALMSEFEDVFKDCLGKYKGTPISFNLDPQVAPIRIKARRVPFALKPKIDKEIDKLIRQGILVPVDHAKWETPIVTPVKPDGSVRICADYKATLNKALQKSAYPVPVVQHLLHSLGQGQIFAKLDLAQAYQQLPVDATTAEAQTIVTHRGAFKCTRLQFGVSVAPGLFQNLMERLLQGLPGVVPYFDDVLVSAENLEELGERLPLLGLLAGDRPTPVALSPRLTRWTIFLAAYSYKLQHRPGKELGHADALSRCPLPGAIEDPTPGTPVLLIDSLDSGPVTSKEVARASYRDVILRTVLGWVQRGWPAAPGERFKEFEKKRGELSAQGGCLLWGDRVVIPEKLRAKVLDLLHEGHPGIVRMKGLARSYVWWPLMDSEIAEKVGKCLACQESRPLPPTAPVREWEKPQGPWSRIHIDFAGPFHGQTFLVVVDAFSKWLEIILMRSMTAEAVIAALRHLFATHGLPDTLVSDNGPQFTATQFEEYLADAGIRHALSAPFHPASNGLAERSVRSAKEALSRLKPGDWQTKIDFFLAVQHRTPSTATGRSPAELLMGRKLRCPLDRLNPQYTPEGYQGELGKTRGMEIGDRVWARNYGDGPSWLAGQIIKATGPKSYLVELKDNRGKNIGHVDALSCGPRIVEDSVPAASISLIETFQLPLTASDIARSTAKDQVLTEVLNWGQTFVVLVDPYSKWVEFLRYLIDSSGIHHTPSKLASIKDAPVPSCKAAHQAFLGLLNFYSMFLPHKASVAKLLHRLLDKNLPWTWGPLESAAFQAVKDLLTSSAVLVLYHACLPLILTADVSPFGIGAVLSHRLQNGLEAPIAYYSRILSSTEWNYSQIDREALAAVAAVKRFHDYVYGHKFELVTDHKPLLVLLAGDKQTPIILSPQLSRWTTFLATYDYTLVYRPGKP
ncbi:uncharacterized protein K02A2.6-like [Ahaetulla prasina]|uniref:uncharacterized protein K02A2.6-like n=1 Tax=Ahaetulla prasina TaxID=499056 RepID=UPI0026489DDD|nr:uncharacterized protein K02A2.6-like [Ahaetulla prasina]